MNNKTEVTLKRIIGAVMLIIAIIVVFADSVAQSITERGREELFKEAIIDGIKFFIMLASIVAYGWFAIELLLTKEKKE